MTIICHHAFLLVYLLANKVFSELMFIILTMVCSNYQCSSAFCLSLMFCLFYLEYSSGHLLGKSCPLGFPNVLHLFYAVLTARVPFPFGVLGRMRNSIVSVSDHCLFSYFSHTSVNSGKKELILHELFGSDEFRIVKGQYLC